jgi:hypothetical protein
MRSGVVGLTEVEAGYFRTSNPGDPVDHRCRSNQDLDLAASLQGARTEVVFGYFCLVYI